MSIITVILQTALCHSYGIIPPSHIKLIFSPSSLGMGVVQVFTDGM